jgi:hypothetical protein
MKQGFLWLAGAVFVLFTGCGLVDDNYQKVANDFLRVLKEFNDVLESVHNGKEAEGAVGKIEKLAIRVDELTLRIKKLPPSTKETGALDDDFKKSRDREQNRFREVQQRLDSRAETALVLKRAMMQFSRAVYDLDVACYYHHGRSFRHSVGNPGGPSRAVSSSAVPARPDPARPAAPDAFQMAREGRMRQLAGKYGSNRVAMVRLVDLSPAANRAKLFDEVRASAKVQDTSMTVSPDELTVFLAPVVDLQAVAGRVPYGKVTQVDAVARTITVSMKGPK